MTSTAPNYYFAVKVSPDAKQVWLNTLSLTAKGARLRTGNWKNYFRQGCRVVKVIVSPGSAPLAERVHFVEDAQ